MAESVENSNNCAAMQDHIDIKFEKIRIIEDDLKSLKTNEPDKLTRLSAKNDGIISAEFNFKSLSNTKTAMKSEIDTVLKFTKEKHEETVKIQLAKEVSRDEGLEEMILYENALQEVPPKFRGALRIYNDEYLTQEINDLKNERRNIEKESKNLEPKIQTLGSKHKLDEIESIREDVIIEPLKLKQIWSDSNFHRASKRKVYEYSTQELDEKFKFNAAKIAGST